MNSPILIYEPDFINKFIHRDKDNAVNSNRKRVGIFPPSLHSCFQQGTSSRTRSIFREIFYVYVESNTSLQELYRETRVFIVFYIVDVNWFAYSLMCEHSCRIITLAVVSNQIYACLCCKKYNTGILYT